MWLLGVSASPTFSGIGVGISCRCRSEIVSASWQLQVMRWSTYTSVDKCRASGAWNSRLWVWVSSSIINWQHWGSRCEGLPNLEVKRTCKISPQVIRAPQVTQQGRWATGCGCSYRNKQARAWEQTQTAGELTVDSILFCSEDAGQMLSHACSWIFDSSLLLL
jgi:hypothetical protein